MAACGGGGSQGTQPPGSNTVIVEVSPGTANVRAGDTLGLTATVTGSTNTTVRWSVNGAAGGSATDGTVDPSGNYTAPSALPSASTVSVTATSAADSTAKGTSTITLLNPVPTIAGISPAATNLGNYTLTVTGTKFVAGSQVLVGGVGLHTTVVSATQLTATGTATSAGTYPVEVRNPSPGSMTSGTLNFVVNGSQQQTSNCGSMSTGQGASLNGFVPFPSDSLWNKDISGDPVDAKSSAILSFIGTGAGIHADFGSGLYSGSSIGIPYTVVDSTQPMVPVNYTDYGDESDAGPMPISLSAPIEGYPNPGSGDRHVLVLDTATCFLYELYSSYPQTNSWNAGSGAVWDLTANEQRPYTWTSADAAGLPIFPGLVRYDEVAAGEIKHAIRFTVQSSSAGFVPPASHWAGNSSNVNAPPMGMKLRLKATFDVSGYSAANQVILNAMKKYGLILADNGSSLYISGAPDDRWDNSDLHNLGNVHGSDFEVVQMTPIYTSANVPTGSAPTITQFQTSASSITAGSSATLSWQVSGASYVIVSPEIGATRGTSVTVKPGATTTYTLYATNAYGQTTATVSVTVH